ncbi:hypothetical protein CFP71_06620 [Amycolatopsis thailandensis]|uniref:Metal transporter n=1 Tax=Amycolatopsis thailandensis TaxID=589330 RepID=A0A229SGC2_9PSEU|nr:hypothetical protein CFP71_06620 [Amycolatopsis thailandensis]
MRIGAHDRCLAHSESAVQDEYFAGIAPGSNVDLRGTELSALLIDRLLYVTRIDGGRSVLGEVDFAEVTLPAGRFYHVDFSGRVDFDSASIGEVYFIGAHFADRVDFRQATFALEGIFATVKFGGMANFHETCFKGGAILDEDTVFLDSAWFESAIFLDHSYFGGVGFNGFAQFGGARFSSSVSFRGAVFEESAQFQNVYFGGRFDFAEVVVAQEAIFRGVEFEKADLMGPMLVEKLTLKSAVFRRNIRIESEVLEGDALEVDCTRAVFEEGVSLRLSRAEVKFDQVILRKPSTIVADTAATLLSLRETDVADLMLTDISLSECHFAGAHHLDKLRLEGTCTFGSYRNRQALAEELAWRSDRNAPVGPRRIADLYRQLRKAQEDSKNEPGAADFYYGEMEMRRHSPATPWSERVILHLYWLVSGYGLRALRALATLAVLIAVVSVSMWLGGFKTTPVFGDTLIYVAQSTVSLETKLTSLPKDLTPFGEVMRLVMRVLGPLLLGLTLLAVRNRVKR